MNTVILDHVYVGGPAGESPAPAPSAEILFALDDPSQANINIGAGSTAVIEVDVVSSIEGVQAPFTSASNAQWAFPVVLNGGLRITPARNSTPEQRVATITLTQQELCGTQRTITITLTQEAAEPVIGDVVITNPTNLAYASNNPIIAYLKQEIEENEGGVIKTVQESAGAPAYIDPKDLWNFQLFSKHTSQFQDNLTLTSAAVLAFLNVPRLVGACFRGCTHLQYAIVPACVTEVSDAAFESCGAYEPEWHQPIGITIAFLGTTPPTFGTTWARYASILRILVPEGCGDAYKAAVGETLADLVMENSAIETWQGIGGNVEYTSNGQGYYTVTGSGISYADLMNYVNN